MATGRFITGVTDHHSSNSWAGFPIMVRGARLTRCQPLPPR
jgi:hypothetical protein